MTKKDPTPFTPWGLTKHEIAVMEAQRLHGTTKLVAAELDVEPRQVEVLMGRIRKKMGLRSKTLTVLTYDRWKREQE